MLMMKCSYLKPYFPVILGLGSTQVAGILCTLHWVMDTLHGWDWQHKMVQRVWHLFQVAYGSNAWIVCKLPSEMHCNVNNTTDHFQFKCGLYWSIYSIFIIDTWKLFIKMFTQQVQAIIWSIMLFQLL